jgi:hypothetical protein
MRETPIYLACKKAGNFSMGVRSYLMKGSFPSPLLLPERVP